MNFPVHLTANISSHNGSFNRSFDLNKGLTVLLGPNGSGKTHLLRGLKNSFGTHVCGKKVRFLSAGRMGMLEQFRSDFDGHRGGTPNYDDATYGGKQDSTRRHQIETLSGDFQTLAERADILVKIQERLKKLFKRDLMIEWDAGNLKILFSRLDAESQPYSSGREASGLMHLVGILSALYDDEVGALLLDEPEVSLHPQLQAFLLNEIISVAGHPSEGGNKKFVVIATHSTEMVQITRPDDLLSLVFCYDLNSDPVQIAADAGELKNKKIQGLIARLGQEHKLSLFCKRPLLVEGPSDMMICSALSSKADIHLEAAGSQLLPVIGKGQMPIVAKLFRILGKEPVALTDADGIADGLDLVNQFLTDCSVADTDAAVLGFASATAMANNIYGDFCKLVQGRWSEISAKAEPHPYWVNKKAGEDDLAKRRAVFCTLFTIDDADLSKLVADDAWLKIKQRISALLDVLEKSGLFVLRRGSIESYYQKSDRFISIGKPRAAADEMEYISQLDKAEIQAHYADVLRCVQFASNAESICEADALRDLLLSVAAPAHARLKTGGAANNFNILARSILGDRSKIFDLAVIDEAMVISIASKILSVTGFPLTISKDDDVVKSVSAALASNT
ncbi:MAG: AAA family ATPase [Thiobacillus sp.]|nr:AAA family ATPase [Thiobacillus sp.]